MDTGISTRRDKAVGRLEPIGERKRRVAHTSPTHTRLSTHNVQGQGDTPPTRVPRNVPRTLGPRHPHALQLRRAHFFTSAAL